MWNPTDDWNPESKVKRQRFVESGTWNPESGIHGVEFRLQYRPGFKFFKSLSDKFPITSLSLFFVFLFGYMIVIGYGMPTRTKTIHHVLYLRTIEDPYWAVHTVSSPCMGVTPPGGGNGPFFLLQELQSYHFVFSWMQLIQASGLKVHQSIFNEKLQLRYITPLKMMYYANFFQTWHKNFPKTDLNTRQFEKLRRVSLISIPYLFD